MAIDLLTYEFLKRYVEGSQMGQYAKPQGVWDETKTYSTGDYVTYKNVVYIVPFDPEASINSSESEKIQTVTGTKPDAAETPWQKIAGVDITIDDATIKKNNGQIYYKLKYQFNQEIGDYRYYNEDKETWVGRPQSNVIYYITEEETSSSSIVLSAGSISKWFAFCGDGKIRTYSSNNWPTASTPPSEWEEISGGAGNIENLLDSNASFALNQILDSTNMRFKDTTGDRFNFIENAQLNSNPVFDIDTNDNGEWSWPNGAFGEYSVALHGKTHAEGKRALSTGSNTVAHGENSFTTGNFNLAYGESSVAEGTNTTALGNASHAEGIGTTAGNYEEYDEAQGTGALTVHASHAEGYETIASGYGSHAEGLWTEAQGSYSHTEGKSTIASIENSHTEGTVTKTEAKTYVIEAVSATNITLTSAPGFSNTYTGTFTFLHPSGKYSGKIKGAMSGGKSLTLDTTDTNTKTLLDTGYLTSGSEIFIIGTEGQQQYSNPYGLDISSHAEGGSTVAGIYGHAEGLKTTAMGYAAHAEGSNTYAYGDYSHAEGHGDGTTDTIAKGAVSHAEGYGTQASGNYSHSEGFKTIASGAAAHAEGYNTQAKGERSHAEGNATKAQGAYSHAEGEYTNANGIRSHASGNQTFADGENSFVIGKFNKRDLNTEQTKSENKYAFIIGNGDSAVTRSNAMTIDWDGNMEIAGDICIGENQILSTYTPNSDEEPLVNVNGDLNVAGCLQVFLIKFGEQVYELTIAEDGTLKAVPQ